MNNLQYDAALSDVVSLRRVLEASGLNCEAAREKACLFKRAADALGAKRNTHAFFVPGRVEVLGKHTDYAGGSSILAAAEMGFCIAAAPRDDDKIRLIDAGYGDETEFRLGPDLTPTLGHWSNYPMTVARRIARNFPPPLRGMDVALASDLPPAAGMSSSSALMVAFFHALAAVNRLADRPEYRENIESRMQLAEYLGTVDIA